MQIIDPDSISSWRRKFAKFIGAFWVDFCAFSNCLLEKNSGKVVVTNIFTVSRSFSC
jgi:hypothetical protein